MMNYFSVISVSGEQAQPFLQGQLTCDMRTLKSEHALLGACCDHKGRIISNFWIGQWQQAFYLLLPKTMVSLTLAHLNKYAIFSKVTITECTDWTGLVYQSHELPTSTITPLIQASIENLHWLIGPHQSLQVAQQTLDKDSHPIQSPSLELMLIEKKIVFIEPAISERCLPQMIGWEKLGGVSFEKGCYVGQEIIARTQHLGKLKRHLYTLTIQTTHNQTPQIGDHLQNQSGDTVGYIVSTALKSDNEYHLLAVLQDHALNEKVLLLDSHTTLYFS